MLWNRLKVLVMQHCEYTKLSFMLQKGYIYIMLCGFNLNFKKCFTLNKPLLHPYFVPGTVLNSGI